MAADTTAIDQIRQDFAEWDLPQSLSDWAWQAYKDYGSDTAAINRINQEMQERPEFKARFPAFEQLKREGRAITPEGYRQYEESIRGLLAQYRLPTEFGARDKIGEMLLSRVSPAEAESRVRAAAYGAYSAPKEYVDAMTQNYGLTGADLTAYWLDPDVAQPVIEQRFAAAQLAAEGLRQGFTDTTSREHTERLQSLGVSREQAATGFERAARLRGLMSGEATVDESQLVDSQFGDVGAQMDVLRSQGTRKARFGGGGSAVDAQQGVVGLGDGGNV